MTAQSTGPTTRDHTRAPAASWLAAVVGAVALLLASTALSGVVGGSGWFGELALEIAVVVGTGIGLRALRVPGALSIVAEAITLACVLTAAFTTRGWGGFVPNSAAFAEFQDVLGQASEQVQTGVPPVPATMPIIALTMLAIGSVAIVVDALVSVALAPAVAGLALLCVFAIPAALADQLLPWWSFVLGAIGFALLLMTAGPHRERGTRAVASASAGGSIAAGVAAAAVVLGLFVGSTFTAVGTAGKLPFSGSEAGNSVGVRLNPFTSLGGQLRRGRPIDLFRVRGLDQNAYLKALTLADFNAKSGWSQGPIDQRSVIGPSLPLPDGIETIPRGQVATVTIEPLGYRDVWLPSYGVPLGFTGEPAGSFYDPTSGVSFTQSREKIQPYQEKTLLPEPSPDQLRSVPGASVSVVNPEYFHHDVVDPRVEDLAIHLTSGQVTDFDRTLAISRYFTDPVNGFTYSLDAGDGSSNDVLVNFLFTTKRGFCEQYASAMAIMLRLLDIPSRVVLGFTAGTPSGDSRILTTNDAHAWVEVYFPTIGWTTFDPTPLADGRGQQPSYAVNNGQAKPGQPADGRGDQPSAAPTTAARRPDGASSSSAVAAPTDNRPAPVGLAVLLGRVLTALLGVAGAATVTVTVLAGRARVPDRGATSAGRRQVLARAAGPGLIGLAVVVAALSWSSSGAAWLLALVTLAIAGLVCLPIPAILRARRRHRWTRSVMQGAPGSATAAWAELRSESSDRGATAPQAETVRAAARRMAREHHLDEAGREGLRSMIAVAEREWYGGRPVDPASRAELAEAFRTVRDSLHRGAPLALGPRLWPPSVLHPQVPGEDATDDADSISNRT